MKLDYWNGAIPSKFSKSKIKEKFLNEKFLKGILISNKFAIFKSIKNY